MLDDVFTIRSRGTTVTAWIETDDGDEIELRAVVYPGCHEVLPAQDHGGLPADPPEIDQLEARVAGQWVDVCDVAWLDDEQCRDLIYEATTE